MSSDNITAPIVNAVIKEKPLGTTCIVTRTNNEALDIVGLLIENNIQAKQIQTNDDFNLYDLTELRDFILDIESENDSYSISDEVWQRAKQKLRKNYSAGCSICKSIGEMMPFER